MGTRVSGPTTVVLSPTMMNLGPSIGEPGMDTRIPRLGLDGLELIRHGTGTSIRIPSLALMDLDLDLGSGTEDPSIGFGV